MRPYLVLFPIRAINAAVAGRAEARITSLLLCFLLLVFRLASMSNIARRFPDRFVRTFVRHRGE